MTAFLFQMDETKRLATNDLGVYLALGRQMAARGGLADVDALTHTVAGSPFVHATWLASWILHATWSLGGYPLLQMLLAASTLATMVIVAIAAHRASKGNAAAVGASTLLCAWLLVKNVGMRPQLFAFPLFALAALLLLTVPRPGPRVLAACAVITALLANLHGSFVLVPVLAGALAGGALLERDLRDTKWLAAIALVSTLAIVANPYGLHLLGYVRDNMSISMDRALQEWAPTWRRPAEAFRLAVALAALGAVSWRAGRLPPRRWLLALAEFLLLAISGERYIVWLAMLLPVALASLLPRREEEAPRTLPGAAAIALAVFFLPQLVILSPWWRVRGAAPDAAAVAQFEPGSGVALAEWAASHGVTGKLFNSMEWGGWLEWRLGPLATGFVDVRVWIFPDDVWKDFRAISSAEPGWEDRLDRRQVDYAILDRRFDAALLGPIAASPRWEKLHEDADGVIYRRRRDVLP